MDLPIPDSGPDVLALGAWLKNVACALRGSRATLSRAHGDLGTPQACRALATTLDWWIESRGVPDAFVHDLHPDFYSTLLARELAGRHGVPALAVQHHHAHVGVVAAEHGLHEPVLGLVLDGVGLGTDGRAWGGELLRVDGHRCERLAHLAPIRLPGADRAVREPWRLLLALGAPVAATGSRAPCDAQQRRIVAQMLERDLNCPSSTAAGRWFDAAAAALGLCFVQAAEAEAAVALERAAQAWIDARGGAESAVARLGEAARDAGLDARLDPTALVVSMARSGSAGTGSGVGRDAARFHFALAHALCARTIDLARRTGIGVVALAGGCWFNRILSQQVAQALAAAGLRVLRPLRVSPGDAGLALGQAWVARCRLGAH